ncbi:transmembrane protein [Perilla frutescens var. hirtella]|uniref:Transmembrane protein n=1 Tax=Perilla frutescens var. hirtella TaxID=608512 RepID=A0AAD4P2V6_PERFH|nr:transmembrane protein [Perilla frutescens var. hirtella]KAH6811185.1 transmembrane protein [Perilla frutescens var. frutescens]KAH6823960.1 transmembrane protein [Perilla frutescens var. hirtella]
MSFLRRLLLLLTISVAGASADQATAYEVLESYGFPQGLLPKGVMSYKLDSSTGKFSINLGKQCSFTIQGYDLKYKTTITGTISRNRIRNLTGIQVKLLFLWVNIVEVTKDGDDLELSVGIASAGFPADGFEESPQCGCGFKCVNSGEIGGGFSFRNILSLVEI